MVLKIIDNKNDDMLLNFLQKSIQNPLCNLESLSIDVCDNLKNHLHELTYSQSSLKSLRINNKQIPIFSEAEPSAEGSFTAAVQDSRPRGREAG